MNVFIRLLPVCMLMWASVVAAASGIPVIYCTDLFHPHDDPDDHFDLACLYAIPELDLQAIILDQGLKQQQKPGKIPVEQMNHLTGRSIPHAIGLAQELKTPSDTGADQSVEFQEGVRLILALLRESPTPATIIAVGSLRDVAAAYNTEPELFAQKVSRLWVFIGDAQGRFAEYNVTLDVNAYRCILNSKLPVHWIPCFDGGIWKNEGNASFWVAGHKELLGDVSPPLFNYFAYALLHKQSDALIAVLREEPKSDEKEQVLAQTRNLWCTAVFPYIANRKYILRDHHYRAVPADKVLNTDKEVELFNFLPVAVHIDDEGRETFDETQPFSTIKRFHVTDLSLYGQAMTSVTKKLLEELSAATVSPSLIPRSQLK